MLLQAISTIRAGELRLSSRRALRCDLYFFIALTPPPPLGCICDYMPSHPCPHQSYNTKKTGSVVDGFESRCALIIYTYSLRSFAQCRVPSVLRRAWSVPQPSWRQKTPVAKALSKHSRAGWCSRIPTGNKSLVVAWKKVGFTSPTEPQELARSTSVGRMP